MFKMADGSVFDVSLLIFDLLSKLHVYWINNISVNKANVCNMKGDGSEYGLSILLVSSNEHFPIP